MTPYVAVSLYKKLCPVMNFPDETLLQWLKDVDGLLQTEVLKIRPQNVVYPSSVEEGVTEALFVPDPYSRLYPLYLTMQAYFWHGEYTKYQNSKSEFDEAVNEWAKWYKRNFPTREECGRILFGYITFIPKIVNGVLKWTVYPSDTGIEPPEDFEIKGITDISAEEGEGGSTLTITYGQNGDTVEVFLPDGTDGKSILYSEDNGITAAGTAIIQPKIVDAKEGDIVLTKNGWVCTVENQAPAIGTGVDAKFNIIGQGGGGADLPQTTNLLKGDGSGGAEAADPGTDYLLPSALDGKENTIPDLATIRSNAELGATALQSVPNTYRTASEQDEIDAGKQPAGDYATNDDLEEGVGNLQEQIDAITSASDVQDVVGTYAELLAYALPVYPNNLIKVLADEIHGGQRSYYRWVVTDEVGSWSYVGSEGSFYTKAQTNTLLAGKMPAMNPIPTANGFILANEYDYAVSSGKKFGDFSGSSEELANIPTAAQIRLFVAGQVSGKESESNKVSSISSASPPGSYPTAAAVKSFVEGKGYLTLANLPIWTGVVE